MHTVIGVCREKFRKRVEVTEVKWYTIYSVTEFIRIGKTTIRRFDKEDL